MIESKSKSVLLIIAKIALSLLVLYFLVHTAQIKPNLLMVLINHPFHIAGVILSLFATIFIAAWRWSRLNAAQAIHPGFVNTVVATYVGGAFNNILPGAIGGDAVRLYFMFKKQAKLKGQAVLAILLDRVIGFIGVFVTIFITSILRIDKVSKDPRIFYLLCICALFCIAMLLAFLAFVCIVRHKKTNEWIEVKFNDWRLMRPVMSFFSAVQMLSVKKRLVLQCISMSVLMQSLTVYAITLLAHVMGLPPIRFSDYVLAVGVTQIVNMIPLTPGGVGIGEFAFTKILLLMNPFISGPYATIFFAYRLISMLICLPGVIIYVPMLIFKKEKNHLIASVA